jgi:hypothetical protein
LSAGSRLLWGRASRCSAWYRPYSNRYRTGWIRGSRRRQLCSVEAGPPVPALESSSVRPAPCSASSWPRGRGRTDLPSTCTAPPLGIGYRRSRSAAVVVGRVGGGCATFVPLFASIPAMVMGHVAAVAFPPTDEILSTNVVGIDPVRALIRRPRPIAVVPDVARSLRVPVALDPRVIRAGLTRHAVRARCRRFANANAEGDLRMGRRCGSQEQYRDRDCPK